MKMNIFIGFCFVLIACTTGSKKKEPQGAGKYTIEQFLQNTEYQTAGFSHDGSRLLVTSNETGIFNLFALPVDGSKPVQLTRSKTESFFAISYFPEDDRILYSADKEGNELDHIYLLKTDGTIKDLTPWDQAKSEFFSWSRDKKSYFFISNRRDQRFFDLYETGLQSLDPAIIYQNDKGFEITAVSSDKRLIALSENLTSSNNELYIFNRETNQTVRVSAHTGDALYRAQFFDVSAQNLYYLTNENSEFMYLVKYSLISGTKDKVWGTGWDIWYSFDSYHEKYRIISLNEDARTVIMMVDLKTGDFINLPDFGESDIKNIGISENENMLYLAVGSCVSPNDIYVYNIQTRQLTKLTNAQNPEIDPGNLVMGRVVRYSSFDGLSIPAIYFQPLDASVSGHVPALVWVHGGPGGQSRLTYSALIQYLVNHGFAILAVNNRGSEGYGKTFYKLDDKKHGDVDLKDCIYGKNFLMSTGVIDPERIGIIGGSYGGFITMAALAFTPQEFAVGVNIFGVTNWIRTLRSIPPYWESFRKALFDEMGDPNTSDSIMLYQISPLFHANHVRKPLIVLQGANDPRVLKAESDDVVDAVMKNGVPVEYILFEDEGHGFLKNENKIEGYRKILDFLNNYLKKRTETNP